MYCFSLLCQLTILSYVNEEFAEFQVYNLFNYSENMKAVPFLPIRNTVYPRSNVMRFPVPDNLVSWMVNYTDYSPEFYESPNIHGKLYADPEIDDVKFHPKWNSIDGNIDRRSFHGDYELQNKYPLNVAGRTGIIGRGLLGRWAVNHAADPVVTRWKRNIDGTIKRNNISGKNVIEMIAIERQDNHEWAIPGGMVDPGEKATATLKREFIEEAMNSNTVQNIEQFFDENGTEIYSGYVDDPRNTDNAWIETVAYNFHDDNGDILKNINFEAGDDAKSVKWLEIDGNIQVYGSHKDIIKKVVERLKAHW